MVAKTLKVQNNPETPKSLNNDQLLVIKEKQPWELSRIFFKDNRGKEGNMSNIKSKSHHT